MMRNFMLLVASTLLALVLAEGVLRIVYEPATALIEGTLQADTLYHLPDPELQIVPRPRVRGEHNKPGSFTSTFTTNSWGLRDREHSPEKPPGTTRIVLIGDSFAWGYGVSDNAIFAARLEERLDGVEVINLGVIGYGLPEEISYFRRLGVLFQPDIVIMALVQNDIVVRQLTGARSEDSEPADSAAQPSGYLSIKRRLAQSSRLYALLSDAVLGSRALVGILVKFGIKAEPGGLAELDFNLMPALRQEPDAVRAGWDRTLDRLRELRALADSLGLRLIVALVPALQSVEPAQLERSLARSMFWIDDFDLDRPYRRLEQFLRAQNIEAINPLEDFRRAFRAGDRLYLRRDMHFNELGHALFTEAIVSHLERDGLDRVPGS